MFAARARPIRPFLLLAMSMMAASAPGQAPVLIRELASRELSIHVGGFRELPLRQIASRESTVYIRGDGDTPYPQWVSRAVSMVVTTGAPPMAVQKLTVAASPTGETVVLDWSSYNELAEKDVQHYLVFVASQPFDDISAMLPWQTVPAGTFSLTIDGLAAWQDHYFAVVPVDALGGFEPTVKYAAAYIFTSQIVARELSLFVGAGAVPSFPRPTGREISLAVGTAAAPARITELVVAASPAGDVATLDWSNYIELAQVDVARYDIYLAAAPFFDLTGLVPLASVPAGTQTLVVDGLEAWKDHYFAVVPVDVLGHYDPVVAYAASYVFTREVVSREVGLFVGDEPASPYRGVVAREMSALVPDDTVPAAVTGIDSGFAAATSVRAYQAIDLRWPNYNELQQVDLARYRIYLGTAYFDHVDGLAPYEIVPAGRLEHTVGGLDSGGIYYVAVVAEDILGNFDPVVRSISAQASVGGVTAVRDLAATSGADSLLFTWLPPAEGVGFLDHYKVYFGGAETPEHLAAGATSYLATGLLPAHGYVFRIVAVDIFDIDSAASTLLAATWLANPTPTVEELDGAVALQWPAATPTSLVKHYALYQAAADFATVDGLEPLATTTATHATFDGLTNWQTYYFAVVAVNLSDGFSTAAPAVAAVPQPDLDGPRVLTATPSGAAAVGPDTQQVFLEFTVVFNEPIDPDSFTIDDLHIADPNQDDLPALDVEAISATEFKVHLPGSVVPGTYTIVVGPDILDLAGNPMNQDGDDTNGEPDEDAYHFTVDLVNPGLPVGNGDGLLGEYFVDPELRLTSHRQLDAQVTFDWLANAPRPELPADHFSIAWSGQVEARFDSDFTFHLALANQDGARLWLNGELLIDGWLPESSGPLASLPVPLAKGRHPVRLEFVDRGGDAAIDWGWSSPLFPPQSVPQEQLYSGLDQAEFAATPTVLPDGGLVTIDTDILLATSTDEADLYYTFGPTDPYQDWLPWDGTPIRLAVDSLLRAVAVKDGLNHSGIRLASFELVKTTLAGHVWLDVDGNGIRDAQEAGLPGILVFVDANDDRQWSPGEPATSTNQAGNFQLGGLYGGQHRLRVQPDGHLGVSFPQTADGAHLVIATTGQQIADLDFGLVDRQPPQASFAPLVAKTLPAAFAGQIDDPTATVAIRFNGITLAATNHGDGTWSIDTAGFAPVADGVHSLELLVADPLGNAAVIVVDQAVRLKSTPPAVVAVSPTAVAGVPLTRFEIRFDSELSPTTVLANRFTLAPPTIRTLATADQIRLESQGQVAVVQFPPQFGNGLYTLRVDSGIEDIFGNSMAAPYETIIALAMPDLAIPALAAAPDTLVAGHHLAIAWTEENLGQAAATGTWRTDFHLLGTSRDEATRLFLGSSHSLGPLPAANSREQVAVFVLPNWLMTGNGLRVQATTNADRRLLEADTSNNAALSQPLSSSFALALHLPVAQANENAGTLRCQVWRNGSTAAALEVELAATPAGKLAFPPQVIIPAGAASTEFDLAIINDTIPGGNLAVELVATATDALAATAELLIIDDDRVALHFQAVPATLGEGEAVDIIVAHDQPGGLAGPLTVSLAATPANQLLLPSQVTIPAGETTVAVRLRAIDDDLYEQAEEVRLTASAPDCQPAQAAITILDNDTPRLAIALDRDSCSEGDGAQAIAAQVSRQARAGADLAVSLSVDNPGAATVPARVVIPAGQTAALFFIAALDNDQVDGEREIELTATALMANCNCAGLAPEATASVRFTVRDNDGPALSLRSDKTLAGEGVPAAFTFTLARNTPADAELEVALAATPAGELALPAAVFLPVGQAAVDFAADTLDDGIQDGTQTVTVRAVAAGHALAETQVMVTDAQLPDLVVADLQADLEVLAGNTFSITFTIANLGFGTAASSTTEPGWRQRLYLSDDPYVGNDLLVGDYAFNGTLPPGPEWAFTQTISAFAPPINGQYWIVAVADAGNAVDELVETNNTRVSALPVTVRPSYTATVQTDFELGLAGRTAADTPSILLYGTATRPDGQPAPHVPVHLHLAVRDFRRVLLAITDATGQFATLFRPLPGEGGLYTVGACHPGQAEAPVQDSFTLLGMRAEPKQLAITLVAGESATGTIAIHNLAELPLADLAAAAIGLPETVTANLQLPAASLPGLATLELDVELLADQAAATQTAKLTIRLTSAAGATLDIPVALTVQGRQPLLLATPQPLYAGMKRGDQTLVELRLQNRGGAETGQLTVDLPTADWLHLATPNPLPSLGPGQETRLALALTPAANADFALFEGRFHIRQTNGGSLPVPFAFRVVSDAVGDLEVTTVNQFFYYAEGAPTLPAGTVQLVDAFADAPVAEAVSDANGIARFDNLAEGYYTVVARADKHRESRGTVFVAAGATTPYLAYLVRRTVEVVWSVREVELEDRVEVIIETTFETNVPAPVVTIEPPIINLAGLTTVGQIERLDLTISNHGLISANNLLLEFDAHPFYAIEPLITDLGDLPARSSLKIPVVLRRIGDYSTLGARSSVPCGIAGRAAYDLCQGREVAGIRTSHVEGDCGGGDGSAGSIVGDPGGGSSSINAHPFGAGKSICACLIDGIDCPCVLPILKVAFDCVLGFIPGIPMLKCIYGGGNCFYGLATATDLSASLPLGCVGAGLDCAEAIGKEFPVLGPIISGLSCIASVVETIEACGRRGSQVIINTRYLYTLSLLYGAAASHRYLLLLYGDPTWLDWEAEARRDWGTLLLAALDPASEADEAIGEAEAAALLAQPAWPAVNQQARLDLIERFNRTVDYWQRGWLAETDVPAGHSLDFIDHQQLLAAAKRIVAANNLANYLGYDDIGSALADGLKQINTILGEFPVAYRSAGKRGDLSTAGQCAKVKLELSQSVVLAREGFEATLQVDNGEEITLTDIGANLAVYDQDGGAAGHLFAVGQPQVAYFTSVDGDGVLTPGSTGTAKWLLVPYAEAAPEQETAYYVEGSLTYAIDGMLLTVPLDPVPITVHPQPELHLAYYHQRDVYSDDPWTEAVELAQPYELAVAVRNQGAGLARKLRILSSQPRIVDNEKGLLVDFKIIGHEVDGQPLSPSLTAEFGDLAAGHTKVARWWMTSTLQGQFTDYQASFEHVGPFGDPRLSQIKSVDIFELIRSVTVAGQTAFLTNDQADGQSYPDTLHRLDGSRLEVATVDPDTAEPSGALAPGQLEITLTLTPAAPGWNYLRLVDRDPGGGDYRLVAVRDQQDASLPATNFWQTDRTFVFGGVRPRLENNLHLLFFWQQAGRTETTFTLVYQSADQAGPALVGLALPAGVPLNQSHDRFELAFAKPVAPGSITTAAFVLEQNGVPLPELPPLTTTLIDATTVEVAGFAPANHAPGTYRLIASATTIADLFGNPGSGTASLRWLVPPSLGPTPERLEIVGKPRQNSPINSVRASFSAPLRLDSVGPADFLLARQGLPIAIGSLAIAAEGDSGFQANGLASFCNLEGDYELTLDAAGILGHDNEPGFGTLTVAWTLDATPPTVDSLTIVARAFATSPDRDGATVLAVDRLQATFSEPLADPGPTLAAVDLLKNGVPVDLPATATILPLAAHRFELAGLAGATAAEGNYALRLRLDGLRDLAGNLATGLAELAWRQDATPPAPPIVLGIVPDTGQADDDFITASPDLQVHGTVEEEELTVAVRLEATGQTVPATLDGLQFSATLPTLAFGTHALVAICEDAAGNRSQTAFSIFVDTVDLDATLTPPDPSTGIATIAFSAPVNPATLVVERFSLTITQAPIDLAGVGVGQIDATTFQIGPLPTPATSGLRTLSLDTTQVEKQLSGRTGHQSFAVSWNPDATLDNLALSPRSSLVDEDILLRSRTPLLAGDTPAPWLRVEIVDALTRARQATAEVADGQLRLPLSLARDGAFDFLVLSEDGHGLAREVELSFKVDTIPPKVQSKDVFHDQRGAVSLAVTFSEPMNILHRLAEGSFLDGVQLAPAGRAVPLAADDFAWNAATHALAWQPPTPATDVHQFALDGAMLTDLAENPLQLANHPAGLVGLRFGPLAATLPEVSPDPGESFEVEAQTFPAAAYQWSFGDGSVATTATATHAYAAGGRYDAHLQVNLDDDTKLHRFWPLGVGETLQFTLRPGWNAVALPNLPPAAESATIANLFADPDGLPLVRPTGWGWQANPGHSHAVTLPQVGQGLWLFRDAPGEATSSRHPGQFVIPSSPPAAGLWHFVGIGDDIDLPEFLLAHPEYAPTVFRWDAATQQLRRLPANARLERGHAYWLRMAQP